MVKKCKNLTNIGFKIVIKMDIKRGKIPHCVHLAFLPLFSRLKRDFAWWYFCRPFPRDYLHGKSRIASQPLCTNYHSNWGSEDASSSTSSKCSGLKLLEQLLNFHRSPHGDGGGIWKNLSTPIPIRPVGILCPKFSWNYHQKPKKD